MSYGLENAGLQCIASVDNDKWASETHIKTNQIIDSNKNVYCCDIRDLHQAVCGADINLNYQSNHIHKQKEKRSDNSDLEEAINFFNSLQPDNVDLIVGGPPCQGFSTLARGTKKRLLGINEFVDDPRNQLFKYYLDFINKYQPKVVLIENVRGIMHAKGYASLIANSLENTGLGYDVKVVGLNASKFGVPQDRNRVFFIGFCKSLKKSFEYSFYFENELYSLVEKPITAKQALGDLPVIKSNPKKLNLDPINEIPFGLEGSFGMTESNKSFEELVQLTDYNSTINTFLGKYIQPKKLYNHKARFNNEDDLEIYQLLKPGLYLDHIDNKAAFDLVKYETTYVAKDGSRQKSFQDKYFKIHPDKPSRTIVAHMQMDTNGYVHYGDIPRGITPREAARLQSFPDWFNFSGPFTTQYRQIGNAVPPMLAKKIGQVIKYQLES